MQGTIAKAGARGLVAPGPLSPRSSRHWAPYLLVAPPVLLIASLAIYPLIYNIGLSVHHYRTGEFVGLANFAQALADPQFLASLHATAIFVTSALVVEVLLGLGLALLIHRTIRSGWARTLIYILFLIPMVTPPVAAGVVARLIYTPTYGVLNVLLMRLGVIHQDILWLGHPETAMFAVLSVDVWQWMPFVFLVCFAGLQAVPLDTVEAAVVDGADGWRLFRHIELPHLETLLLLVVVFRFTDTFRVFDHVLVLTGGGPGATTEFLSVYLYRIAFKFFNLNYSAALSLFVLLVASVAFTVLTRYLGREVTA
jgi:multiple sugar transport system permease protein